MTPRELKRVITEHSERTGCSDELYAADSGGYDVSDEILLEFDEQGAVLHLVEHCSTQPILVQNAWQRENFRRHWGTFRLVLAESQPEQPVPIGEEIPCSREVIRSLEQVSPNA